MKFVLAWTLWRLIEVCVASTGIQSGKAADFYVPTLPGLAPGTLLPEMHAGLLEVGSKLGLEPASLFFWHIRAAQDTKTTVIWLNGGPGCSSMDGNLLEIGPFRFGDKSAGQDKDKLYNSEGNWAEVANLLFVDQPFGTGYSDPADRILLESVEKTAEAFVVFLREYVSVFPEIAQTQIVLAGESFAGQYIPHIWHALQSDTETWNKLNGIQYVLLGNPWMDPPNQYLSTPQFVKEHQLIPTEAFDALDELNTGCVEQLQDLAESAADGKIPFKVEKCEIMSNFVLRHSFNSDAKKCFNMYNIELASPYPQCGMEWPPAVGQMKTWLSREDVRRALHAPVASDGEKWVECNTEVHKKLKTGSSAKSLVPQILESVPLLLMIGDNDFICNPLGQDRMVANLEWNGLVGFTEDSQLETNEYGTWRSERNLTVAHITNGSHMAPVDNLEYTRDLLMTFISLDNLENRLKLDFSNANNTSTTNGTTSEEEINNAMYRAYGQAGIAALIVVLIVCGIFIIIWWRNGQGLSCQGFLKALLHSSMRVVPRKRQRNEYVPLHSMKRMGSPRPEVIIEEDEEDLEV